MFFTHDVLLPALLYLHRGYFVRALSDHHVSQDLLEGRYAPSVLAIFRSSCVMIAMLQALERVNGELAKRFWLYWCHGLAAAVSRVWAWCPGLCSHPYADCSRIHRRQSAKQSVGAARFGAD